MRESYWRKVRYYPEYGMIPSWVENMPESIDFGEFVDGDTLTLRHHKYERDPVQVWVKPNGDIYYLYKLVGEYEEKSV
jgi:hypothetical protein